MEDKIKSEISDENIKRIDDPILIKYIKEIQDDTSVTRYNIGDKAMMMSGIHNKWIATLMNEKEYLKKAKAKKESVLKEKSNSKVSDSILKKKIMDQVSSEDEEVKKYNILIDRIKTRIDYLERTMNVMSNMVWYIKSGIESMKFER